MRQKRQNSRKKTEEKIESRLHKFNPEARQGILVVVLLALAAVAALSFFGFAGSVGVALDRSLALFFGWDRFLLPVVLVGLGFVALNPEKRPFSTFNYIGLFFFFLSFNALINLF